MNFSRSLFFCVVVRTQKMMFRKHGSCQAGLQQKHLSLYTSKIQNLFISLNFYSNTRTGINSFLLFLFAFYLFSASSIIFITGFICYLHFLSSAFLSLSLSPCFIQPLPLSLLFLRAHRFIQCLLLAAYSLNCLVITFIIYWKKLF